jgi:hypothetical protein
MRRVQRPDLIAFSVTVGLAVLFGLFHWWHDAWLARVDLMQQAIPLAQFLGAQLRAGDLPGWNPHVLGGAPFAGDPLTGWTNLPVTLWFTLADPITAIKLVALTNLVIASSSSWLFARLLGPGWFGASVASIAFAYSTFIVEANTYCCQVYGYYAVWIPVALIGPLISLRGARRLTMIGGIVIGAVGFGQMMGSWIGQGTWYALLLLGSFVLAIALAPSSAAGRSAVRRFGFAVIVGGSVVLLGTALAAASVLPRLAISGSTALDGGAAYSNRNAGRTLHSLLQRLFDAVMASDFGYLGIVATVLGLLALPLAGARFHTPYFAAVLAACLVLFTRSSWLHDLLFLLPRFEKLHIHAPMRLVPVAVFALAMLVGIAADRLATARPPRWSLVIPPASVVVVWFVLRPYQDLHGMWYPRRTWVLFAVATIVVGAALAAAQPLPSALARRVPTVVPRWIHRGALAAIPLLLLLDLNGLLMLRTIVGNDGYWPETAARARTIAVHTQCEDPGGAGEFLATLRDPATGGPVRYAGFDPAGLRTADTEGIRGYHDKTSNPDYQPLLTGLRAICLGLYDVQGYHPIQQQRYVDALYAVNGVALNYHDGHLLSSAPTATAFPLLGARYLILPFDIPPDRADLLAVATSWTEVPDFANGVVRVFENPAALPYAWVVHEARVETPDTVWGAVTSGVVDPRVTVVLETAPPALPVGTTATPALEDVVTVTAFSANRIVLTVDAAGAGYVVVNELYADGWHATVDGVATPILAANGAWRAIPVAAGTQEVVMTYHAPWLREGMVISGVAWLVVVAVAAWWGIDRRRTSTGSGVA